MLAERFDALVETIIHGLCEQDPVHATYLGIHNFDMVMPRISRNDLKRYADQLDLWLGVLEEFEERRHELDENRQIDCVLLRALIRHTRLITIEQQPWHRNPAAYSEAVLYGCYLLVIRKSGSPAELSRSLLARLDDCCRFLAEAGENLSNPAIIPGIWLETALGQLQAGEQFISNLRQQLISLSEADPALITNRIDACLAAMETFADHLRTIAAECRGEFACGVNTYERILQEHHMLDCSATELHGYGEEMIRETLEEMERIAAEIDMESDYAAIISRLKDDHPAAESLVETYKERMLAAKSFVTSNHLASIPADQTLEVEATPVFQRSTIPYAAYVPPPPFSGGRHGIFWVTPPDEQDAEKAAAQLRDHSLWGIDITALHEGFPGHHLQLSAAIGNRSPVRRFYMCNVLVEGWALYCEEMMREQGFLNDPRHHLMQLKDQLWRACRIVIDTGLHCRGMSIPEAEKMLVEVAGLEPANATSEVRRYTSSPVQPSSYLAGKREMTALRDWWFSRDRGSLHEFHDAVLTAGSLPFRIIRRTLDQAE